MRGAQDGKQFKHLPKAEKIIIKKNKKNKNITKFKLRTSKYLITLKFDGRTRAEKIKQSIPAGKQWLPSRPFILNIVDTLLKPTKVEALIFLTLFSRSITLKKETKE